MVWMIVEKILTMSEIYFLSIEFIMDLSSMLKSDVISDYFQLEMALFRAGLLLVAALGC
jgi:hypothetical protein